MAGFTSMDGLRGFRAARTARRILADPHDWFDRDGDGVGDFADRFPFDPSETKDSDGDGVGDSSDPFPLDATEWSDLDGDGVGDNSDAFPGDVTRSRDRDGDRFSDAEDAFPDDPREWIDSDRDGIGNRADTDGTPDDVDPDDDNDEVVDGLDVDPTDPLICSEHFPPNGILPVHWRQERGAEPVGSPRTLRRTKGDSGRLARLAITLKAPPPPRSPYARLLLRRVHAASFGGRDARPPFINVPCMPGS